MDLGAAYSPNYFSLQDILASHIRVPVVTRVPLRNLGYLDPSLNSEHLPEGSKIELPCWAAQAMVAKRFVAPAMPKVFKESYMEAVKADPSVVDLSKLCPFFYQSGLSVTALPIIDAEEVGETLPQVLQHRLRSLTDSLSYETKLVTIDDDPLSKKGSGIKTSHLDSLEQKVFEDAKKSYSALSDWLEKK